MRVKVGRIVYDQHERTGYFDAHEFCSDHNKFLDDWVEENLSLLQWFEKEYDHDPLYKEIYMHPMFLPLIAIWCDPMYMSDVQDHYYQEPEVEVLSPEFMDLD